MSEQVNKVRFYFVLMMMHSWSFWKILLFIFVLGKRKGKRNNCDASNWQINLRFRETHFEKFQTYLGELDSSEFFFINEKIRQ